MARDTGSTVIGVLLIVLGLLLVLGKLGIGGLLPFAGIVLIILGILILIGTFPGGTLVGIACLVIGVLLAAGFLPLPKEIAQSLWIVNIVLGIILIVFGVQRLR
jgi:hypothetical protein